MRAAGPSKNEIDCVGGVAKIAIRTSVSTGKFFCSAADCIEYLSEKFGESIEPEYCFKEICSETLSRIRSNARYMNYGKLQNSSKQRVLIFHPNSTTVLTAPYLCVCESCSEEFGSCDLFQEYCLESTILKKNHLRSDANCQVDSDSDDADGEEENVEENDDVDMDFFASGTICCIAADKEDTKTFYFFHVNDVDCTVKF